jgi:hypothetical protein
MGKARPHPVVLDAGALIAFERREQGVVVTSDVDDLHRLDPGLRLERI